jgi:lactam utilization protein B
VFADKGYDANGRVIERLQAQGKTAVIPPKCNRTTLRVCLRQGVVQSPPSN